jgi:hypothetical protein
MQKIAAILTLVLLSTLPAYAAPTQFLSPNFGVESVIFGGTGVLRSAEASIPPIITSGPTVAPITTSAATVQWTTDKPSNSVLFVGPSTGNYTIQTGQLTNTTFTNHSVTVTNLTKGTLYFYKVRSSDVNGNIVESAESTFTTDPGDITAPIITSGPTIAKNSASLVTVTWQTNEVASSVVEYGIQNVTENSVGRADDLTLFHQIQIVGLQSSQKYLVRVKSKDASGNTTVSDTQVLQTLESPNITAVKISDITLNSALVQWETTSPSTTIVNYGTTSGTYTLNSTDSASYTTSHLVRLSGLVSGSVYYLRILGADQSGNHLTSDEYTFKTVVLPIISDFKVSEISSSGAKLTWNSSSEIDEFLRYEITDSTDKTRIGKKFTTGNDALSAAHTFLLDGLDSGATYAVTAVGKDIFGNQAVSSSLSFVTLPDVDPPIIQNVRTDTSVDLGSKQTVQALVSFSLSEPGISYIDYGLGASGDFSKQVTTDQEYSLSKFMVIPSLEPGQSYHFRIVAKDRAGNVAKSAEFLLLAPAPQVSWLDLVAKQFINNFGFLTKLGGK